MKRLLISLTLLAMAFSPAAFAQNADKKETCETMGTLGETTAILRDRGFTKQETINKLLEATPDKESLITEIADWIYDPNSMKFPPSEFKKALYDKCMNT